MKRSRSSRSPTVLVALAFALGFDGAAAQETHRHGTRYPLVDGMHNEALEGVTASSAAFPAALKEASKRHARVVAVRQDDDVRRFECLADQSALLHAIGDLTGALDFMERAADHARDTGDVYSAAMAYVDAAIIAGEAGRKDHAERLVRQAKLLTLSPYLHGEDRTAIVERLGGSS